VVGDEDARSAGMAKGMWERMKAADRRDKGQDGGQLDQVPVALPALTRALKLQARAARVGFDWGAPGPVLDKIEEEAAELREAVEGGMAGEKVEEEVGDLLFAMVNLARHLEIDPERALRRANDKFVRRFRHVEQGLAARGIPLEEAGLQEIDALWEEAKAAERAGPA